jgi:hypothetical protein
LLEERQVHAAMDAMITDALSSWHSSSSGGGVAGDDAAEDDSSWLNVSAEELEEMLRERAPPPIPLPPASTGKVEDRRGGDGGGDEDGDDEEEDENEGEGDDLPASQRDKAVVALDAIVDGVHRFLGSSGAVSGAEVPRLPSPPPSDSQAVRLDVEAVLGALRGGDHSEKEPDIWNDSESSGDSDDGGSEHGSNKEEEEEEEEEEAR